MPQRLTASYGIASALSHLHKHSILYRDLKPANVGFDVRDDVKIFDFGLAKELSVSNNNNNNTSNGIDNGSKRQKTNTITNQISAYSTHSLISFFFSSVDCLTFDNHHFHTRHINT